MGIHHRRRDVPVAQELLHRANVVARLEEVGGKGMPESMATGRLWYTRLSEGVLEHALNQRFVQMMTPALASRHVLVDPGGRKAPLPGPLSARIGILHIERARQLHPPRARLEILLVLLAHGGQVMQ